MRTRTLYGDASAMTWLQQESDCCIHIQRDKEVRIFGPDESVAMAEGLLDRLAANCTEESLTLGAMPATALALQALSKVCGVTLTEEGRLVVLGLWPAVAAAAKESACPRSSPS